jgi:hypothetical protein
MNDNISMNNRFESVWTKAIVTYFNIILLRVSWEASLLGGSLLGNTFMNMLQYCRRC